MRTKIRLRDLPPDDELEAYIDRRARFALGRFSSRISALQVTVSDENGPRGGVDKLCRASATLVGMPTVTADSLDASCRDAVDRTLARLARAVRRALDVRALYAAPVRSRTERSRSSEDA